MSLYSWQVEGTLRSKVPGSQDRGSKGLGNFLGLGMADRLGPPEEEAAGKPGRPSLGMFCV